ncbi:MAG TPA: hypothetical protein VFT81_01400 [Dermatophilaceae bacterium]|nr:hypothetical protein [Dermatophilaceae bacterium]
MESTAGGDAAVGVSGWSEDSVSPMAAAAVSAGGVGASVEFSSDSTSCGVGACASALSASAAVGAVTSDAGAVEPGRSRFFFLATITP